MFNIQDSATRFNVYSPSVCYSNISVCTIKKSLTDLYLDFLDILRQRWL